MLQDDIHVIILKRTKYVRVYAIVLPVSFSD